MTMKLGLLMSEEKMKYLPLEMQEKYLQQKRENELNELTDEILREFTSHDYEIVLSRYLDYLSSADEKLKELIKKDELITEMVTGAIFLVFSGELDSASRMENLDKAIKEVFGTGLGCEPWKSKLLENMRKYPHDIDYLDYLIVTAKAIGVEKEYKKVMEESLAKIEEDGINLMTFKARQKLEMRIDNDYAAQVRLTGDGSLRIEQYSYAMRIYKAMAEAGHGDKEVRDKMVALYYSKAPEAYTIEVIKKMAIDSGIMPKPIENPIVDTPKAEKAPKKQWWKFW